MIESRGTLRMNERTGALTFISDDKMLYLRGTVIQWTFLTSAAGLIDDPQHFEQFINVQQRSIREEIQKMEEYLAD